MNDNYSTSAERVMSRARKMLYREPFYDGPKRSSNIPKFNSTRKMVYCACGNKAAYPGRWRNNERVCTECAAKIPPNPSGRPCSAICSVCGEVTGRGFGVVRNGKLVCKKCVKIKL